MKYMSFININSNGLQAIILQALKENGNPTHSISGEEGITVRKS